MEKRLYLKWLSLLCALMALFGVGVLAVGYQPVSFGRAATIVVLFAAAAVLAALFRRSSASR